MLDANIILDWVIQVYSAKNHKKKIQILKNLENFLKISLDGIYPHDPNDNIWNSISLDFDHFNFSHIHKDFI